MFVAVLDALALARRHLTRWPSGWRKCRLAQRKNGGPKPSPFIPPPHNLY